jgi:hypothetical protein
MSDHPKFVSLVWLKSRETNRKLTRKMQRRGNIKITLTLIIYSSGETVVEQDLAKKNEGFESEDLDIADRRRSEDATKIGNLKVFTCLEKT